MYTPGVSNMFGMQSPYKYQVNEATTPLNQRRRI